MPEARGDSGFTLAEVMAALAVFSIAALALLHLSAENARAAGVAHERAFAGLIAENLMVEAAVQPDLAPVAGTGETRMDGRDWDWTRRLTPTGEPGMMRVDVEVRLKDADYVSAALTGFRTGE